MHLLQELCEASGIPGREERIRAIVRRELEPLVDEIKVDAMGNLIAIRRGNSDKKLLISAHMDEIGFIVTHIEDGGFLRMQGLGGHSPRNMMSQHVSIAGKEDMIGLLHCKRPEGAEAEKVPKTKEFFVDTGLTKEEATEQIPIGSMVTLERNYVEIGNAVSCKAMDDRVSLYIMIETMRRTKKAGFEVYAVASVQEEVGIRGATTASYAINPDVGIALDVTLADDIPGVGEAERITSLGKGAAIKIMDSSVICNAKVVDVLRELAVSREITHQMEILPAGGTDAGAIQSTRGGIPAGVISTPTRYVHSSVEMCNKDDIEAVIALMSAFIEEGHQHDYFPQ